MAKKILPKKKIAIKKKAEPAPTTEEITSKIAENISDKNEVPESKPETTPDVEAAAAVEAEEGKEKDMDSQADEIIKQIQEGKIDINQLRA